MCYRGLCYTDLSMIISCECMVTMTTYSAAHFHDKLFCLCSPLSCAFANTQEAGWSSVRHISLFMLLN